MGIYDVITVTATTDAEGIAQNKVVAQSIEIANAVRVKGKISLNGTKYD